MKIRSIHIGSFGKIRNQSMEDLPEGLVLVLGNNESGKTTIMEFMRTTMFPTSKRSTYPSSSKTDCGSMELVTGSGEAMNLLREQKRVSEVLGRKLPSELFQMDSDTYNSIFAMSLEDLTNEDAISSERIRNRFLTIPGGEKVPAVLKTVSSLKKELMNDERLSDRNPISILRNELLDLDKRIADAKGTLSEYDRFAEDMRTIELEISNAEAIQKKIDQERKRYELLGSQRNNIDRIFQLRSEREGLEYAFDMSEEESQEHTAAEERVRRLEITIAEIGNVEAISEDELSEIKMVSREADSFISRSDSISDKIESLKDSIAEDEEKIDEIGIPKELTEDGPRRELERIGKGKVPVSAMIALIIAAAAFAAAVFYEMLIAVAGVFMLLIAISLIVSNRGSKRLTKWMTSHGLTAMKSYQVQTLLKRIDSAASSYERIDENSIKLQNIQDEVASIETKVRSSLTAEGIPYTDIGQASEQLKEIIQKKEADIRIARKLNIMKEEMASALSDIDRIETKYGGNENFLKTRSDRSRLLVLDQELKVLSDSVISSTGVNADTAMEELRIPREMPVPEIQISDLNIRKGETKMKMDSLLSSTDLNRLLTEKNSKRAELIRKVKEWGALSIQEGMVNLSCTELYRRMQPAVITTANRYLSMMTDGRYTIDADPRLEGIVIKDAIQHKTSDQWSSGLGDQVYLSIKMAIAKEMGSEHLPMILDDVLVRFDRKRRKGACQAILDFAKDQQVFLFSCDRSMPESFPPDSKYVSITIGS